MPRKQNRLYKKGAPHRDSMYFVIVCEGEKTEEQYFSFFKGKSQRIKIVTRPSSGKDHGKSAPKHLLTRANEYALTIDLKDDDFLWFVLDTDRWPRAALEELRQECVTKKWDIAISNPCFEVWLYMHVSDIEKCTSMTSQELKRELNDVIKGGYKVEVFVQHIEKAIERGRKSDKDPKHYIPAEKSTKVYLLAEKMLEIMGNSWQKH